MKTSEPLVTVFQEFASSVEDVWNAITKLDEMHVWYFDNIPDFKPEVGFETSFLIENEGRKFLHQWRVTEVDAPRKIVYDWSFDGYAGESCTAFELSKQNGKTRLTLTCHVRKDFPDDIPEFKRESCLDGWTYFIKQSLKDYLDNMSI